MVVPIPFGRFLTISNEMKSLKSPLEVPAAQLGQGDLMVMEGER